MEFPSQHVTSYTFIDHPQSKNIFISRLSHGQFEICPCILFHGQYHNENKILHILTSKIQMPVFETILVCDGRNAIYAQKDGALYELKLPDMIDTCFSFKKINNTN